ncbi:MAG TPA: hypothetical protein ENK75_00910 [Saprospiraceae bacterium]|nr:hypothetical protein [Saprospiraceae bacterium]
MVHSNNRYYVLREDKDLAELELFLKHRYLAFKESKYGKMVNDNNYNLDIDGYDLQSRHFGLFEYSGRSSRVVGYVRLVQDKVGPQLKDVWQLSVRYPDLIDNIDFDVNYPFPSMKYLEDNSSFVEAYEKYGKIVEASRLSMHPSVRTLSLASFVIQAITAITYTNFDINAGLVSCKLSHLGFYRKLGCILLGKSTYNGEPTYVLANPYDRLPDDFKATAERIGKAFEKYKEVHYYPKRAGVFSPLLSYVNKQENNRSHSA